MEEHVVSRRLQLWRYTVSHRQLLFMSPIDNKHPSRFYTLITNVERISVPTMFECDRMFVERHSNKVRVTFVFEGASHEILAGDIFFGEDGLEYDAPVPLGIW